MDHHHNIRRAGLATPERAHHDVVDLAPLGAAGAAAAGLSAPHKDEAPGRRAEGFRGQGQNDKPDCADYLAGDQPRARPHQRRDTVIDGRASNAPDGEDVSAPVFATLAALALRNGITLIALADGSYLLCKWGMSRALPDLCAVASLLRNMGVSV